MLWVRWVHVQALLSLSHPCLSPRVEDEGGALACYVFIERVLAGGWGLKKVEEEEKEEERGRMHGRASAVAV